MSSLRSLDPSVQPLFKAFVQILQTPAFARFAGVNRLVAVTVTSTRRDMDEQRQLWDCYQRTGCSNCRRTKRCFPAAPPGRSPHGLGIAMDVHLEPPVYAAAGRLWEMIGLRWGGRFDDEIHFDTHPRGWKPPPR